MILFIGNYLNQDNSARGSALGFQIEALPTLKLLRGNVPDSTLLSFIVGTISKEFPDLMNIVSELGLPISLSRVNQYAEMESHMNKLSDMIDNIRLIESEYQASLPRNVDPEEDIPFWTNYHRFLAEAEELYAAVTTRYEKLALDRAKVVKYFLESPSITTETFLGFFHDFLNDFENVRLHQEKLKRNALLHQQQQEAQSRRTSSIRGKSKINALLQQEGGKGVLDDCLSKLRTGSA